MYETNHENIVQNWHFKFCLDQSSRSWKINVLHGFPKTLGLDFHDSITLPGYFFFIFSQQAFYCEGQHFFYSFQFHLFNQTISMLTNSIWIDFSQSLENKKTQKVGGNNLNSFIPTHPYGYRDAVKFSKTLKIWNSWTFLDNECDLVVVASRQAKPLTATIVRKACTESEGKTIIYFFRSGFLKNSAIWLADVSYFSPIRTAQPDCYKQIEERRGIQNLNKGFEMLKWKLKILIIFSFLA